MFTELASVSKIYEQRPNLTKSDVEKIFNWLTTQKHLPQITELQVILFLDSCRYSVEEAKNTIDKYFTFLSKSNLSKNLTEKSIKETLSTCFTGFLPKRTPEGYSVFFFKLLDNRPEKFNSFENTKLTLMSIVLHFHKYGPSNGLIVLCDSKGSSFGHLLRLSLSALRQFMYFLQEAAPVKLVGNHFVNAHSITKHAIAISKPFMKKEIYEMLKIHSYPFDSLYEYIPRECLPKELGGELPSIDDINRDNMQFLLDNQDFFEWHSNQKIDESKKV